jgi:hypothetical protein
MIKNNVKSVSYTDKVSQLNDLTKLSKKKQTERFANYQETLRSLDMTLLNYSYTEILDSLSSLFNIDSVFDGVTPTQLQKKLSVFPLVELVGLIKQIEVLIEFDSIFESMDIDAPIHLLEKYLAV